MKEKAVSRHWYDVPWRRYALSSASSWYYILYLVLHFVLSILYFITAFTRVALLEFAYTFDIIMLLNICLLTYLVTYLMLLALFFVPNDD